MADISTSGHKEDFSLLRIAEEFKEISVLLNKVTGVPLFQAKTKIFTMLEASKGYDTREQSIIAGAFDAFLGLEKKKHGVVRTTFAKLCAYCCASPSNKLRDLYIVNGISTLPLYAQKDPWTAELLARNLREVCRDDTALLAQVNRAIEKALVA